MKRPRIKLLAFLLIAAIVSGCGGGSKGKVIAKVNGEPIYESEIKRELAFKMMQDPAFKVTPGTYEAIIKNLINRRIIIQEAVRERLSETERFADTIKRFWEQTLVRDFLEYKTKEFDRQISITESEIAAYRRKAAILTTFDVTSGSSREELIDIMEAAGEGEEVKWDMTVNLRYGEVPSEVFLKAFDLQVGEMGIYSDDGTHYLIRAKAKKPLEMPPLELDSVEVERRIRDMRARRAFETWLEDKREASEVRRFEK